MLLFSSFSSIRVFSCCGTRPFFSFTTLSTGDDDPSNDFQKSSESSESEDSLSELELEVVISSSGSSPSIPSPADMNYDKIKKTMRLCVCMHVLPRIKEVNCNAKDYWLGKEFF